MTAPAPAVDDRPGGGPPLWFAILGIGGLLVGLVLIVLTLLGVGVGVAGPAPTIAPTGLAAQQTHDLVAKTLGDASFQVVDPQTPYRPGESPDLINVPRRVLQAVLPSDPDKGYVVIYELPSAGDADRVGKDFAAYLGSGTGAIQYPRDAQFVLRRVGQTLVFFPWSPLVSPDPEMARLAATLSTIGEPVVTPS
jgi:hypothetical protein